MWYVKMILIYLSPSVMCVCVCVAEEVKEWEATLRTVQCSLSVWFKVRHTYLPSHFYHIAVWGGIFFNSICFYLSLDSGILPLMLYCIVKKVCFSSFSLDNYVHLTIYIFYRIFFAIELLHA